jgi:hypothetical protein
MEYEPEPSLPGNFADATILISSRTTESTFSGEKAARNDIMARSVFNVQLQKECKYIKNNRSLGNQKLFKYPKRILFEQNRP